MNARKLPNLTIPALMLGNTMLALGTWTVRLAKVESEVGPIAIGFWRLALTLPVIMLAALRIERPVLKVRPVMLIALGGLSFASDLAVWNAGILRTHLANAGLLGNAPALLFPIYGFWVARSWPHARQWIALGLATAGGAILMGRSYTLSAELLIGDLLCLAAGIFYFGYMVAVDKSRGAVPQITTLALSGAAGLLPLLLLSWGVGETIWPQHWTMLFALSIGSQLIGQSMLLYAVANAAPIVVGLMLLSQPVILGVIDWTVYGHRPAPLDILGAIGIGLGVLLVRDAKRPTTLPPTEGAVSSQA